jgi:hypothetical protein
MVAATQDESFRNWSISTAVQILNSSPWARQETFTRVVGGVGSGVSGEREIYNTFYVRFLSARPVREAYARIQQIQQGYDKWADEERRRFDDLMQPSLEFDAGRWVVVAVSFRSNDPNEESRVRQFFESETTGTLRSKAFLSTDSFPQVAVAAYFPPREEGVGARFVFPRDIQGHPVVGKDDKRIAFELLDVPGASSVGRGGAGGRVLRAWFFVEEMKVDGEVVF